MKNLFWFLKGAFIITIASDVIGPPVETLAKYNEVKITAQDVVKFKDILESLNKYAEVLGINEL